MSLKHICLEIGALIDFSGETINEIVLRIQTATNIVRDRERTIWEERNQL